MFDGIQPQKFSPLRIVNHTVLRCYGQFFNDDINDNTMYPRILPQHMKFTYFLIMEVHLRLIHAGIAHALAQIHDEYWIPQGWVEVRNVLLHYIICHRH